MEEVGTQLAAPLFIHQNIAGRFCEAGLIGKKRGLCYSTASIRRHDDEHHHHHQQQQQFERATEGWSSQEWEWDTARFVAKPRPPEPDLLRLGSVNVAPPSTNRQGANPVARASVAPISTITIDDDEQDESGLQLQLGGTGAATSTAKTNGGIVHSSNSTEDPAASLRPNKKVRSGSPGSAGGGGNYPMCQVDNCTEDLSKSKDYHRRHKVCEFHSKATKALVGKQMQRFCQQCSRFHPLSEFDEGKRSCRRRLAGHNRRRRKTQPEDATAPSVHPTESNSTGNGNLDIVNILTVLARGQGNAEQNVPICPSLPDKNQLIQILSKINSLPLPTETAPGCTKNIFEQAALGQNKLDVNSAARSSMDLLAVISTLAASAPDAFAFFSQRNNPSVYVNEDKSSFGNKDTGADVCKKPATNSQSPGGRGERSSSSYQSPFEDSDCQMQDTRINLPLQLFSSSPGDDSPPNLVSSRKYFSSDSSNPTEERCHSSSPPVTRKLFPLETTSEGAKADGMSMNGEANGNVEVSRTGTSASRMTLELFSLGNKTVGDSNQRLPHQAGYTSSSGSDHSPPSFNSDPQMDRTGRIMFKLFDKDPSHFPGALRAQIHNWLSNSPSDMESYIRPGCVVLSIYLSMSSASWGQLEENFLQQVGALVQGSDSDFWRSGRFSVNIGSQVVFHNGGKIRLCKPWGTLGSPELVAVSPLAVVSGQDTSLVIRGRNLTTPGTKIHCTYMGGYSSQEISGPTFHGFTYDEIKLTDFKVHAAASVLGRCFIEVENGEKGNSFPVIIADAKICQELRLLEREFDEETKVDDVICDEQTQNTASPSSHEEVLHFLNELGWLFQRQTSSYIANRDYMLHRFQYLLTFSVERDYCALVKTLLDLLFQRNSGDDLSTEYLEALAKMHLLHRAVKRRSRRMVHMLIHYSVPYANNTSKRYIFSPNVRGPGGITPLHLAACTSGSYDIVDVLTDDPMEIGLHSWKTLLDDNGQSPYAYAGMRNNLSFNNMVAQKVADRSNSQVSLSIGNDILESSVPAEVIQRACLEVNKQQKSCSKCAMMTYRRMPGSHGVLHRPFIHSMLAIAAVCVCVCVYLKSMHVNSVSLVWENLGCGTM